MMFPSSSVPATRAASSMRSLASAAFSWVRQARVTQYPCAASLDAASKPMPEFDPVIMTFFTPQRSCCCGVDGATSPSPAGTSDDGANDASSAETLDAGATDASSSEAQAGLAPTTDAAVRARLPRLPSTIARRDDAAAATEVTGSRIGAAARVVRTAVARRGRAQGPRRITRPLLAPLPLLLLDLFAVASVKGIAKLVRDAMRMERRRGGR